MGQCEFSGTFNMLGCSWAATKICLSVVNPDWSKLITVFQSQEQNPDHAHHIKQNPQRESQHFTAACWHCGKSVSSLLSVIRELENKESQMWEQSDTDISVLEQEQVPVLQSRHKQQDCWGIFQLLIATRELRPLARPGQIFAPPALWASLCGPREVNHWSEHKWKNKNVFCTCKTAVLLLFWKAWCLLYFSMDAPLNYYFST